MEGQWKFGYLVVCQLLYLSWLQDCLNVMHVLQMNCISMLTQCLGCPGDWLEVARCAETCSDNFAVNISFAWSNSLTLTNKSIFQAHIAICGAGRGEEACFLVRYPLNSDQCSVWWQPQSQDRLPRPGLAITTLHICTDSLDFLPLLPQYSGAVTSRARDWDHLRC